MKLKKRAPKKGVARRTGREIQSAKGTVKQPPLSKWEKEGKTAKWRAKRKTPPVRRRLTVTDRPWNAKKGPEPEYGDAIVEHLCMRIALGGTIPKTCKLEGMPSQQTLWKWRRQHPELKLLLDEAREMRAELHIDEVIDIADDATPAQIEKAKVRIATRKWHIEKMHPGRYGVRSQLELAGVGGTPLVPPVINVHFVRPEKNGALLSHSGQEPEEEG